MTRIEMQDAESGRKFSGTANNLNEDLIDNFFNSLNLSDEELRRWIARLPVSADARAILYKIARATIKAGQFVVFIGRKILEIVSYIIRQYPNATFGLVIGAVLGFLVTSIPIIGTVLGPLVTPLAMAIGLAWGAWEDIKDKNMRQTIQEALANFESLKTE